VAEPLPKREERDRRESPPRPRGGLTETFDRHWYGAAREANRIDSRHRASCSEAAKKKPAAWKVVNLSGSARFACPDDARHISFTSGPLLSTTTEDDTYVCAEQL
jgi:hypothetical protein